MRSLKEQIGFSLIEVMVVLLILGIVSGALFSQINTATQRSRAETVKLDYFQEARDFVDQFFRDINQIGYPNSRMVDVSSANWGASPIASPPSIDARLAMGLVKIADNEIVFEADSNGDGNPESVRYTLNGTGSCTLCLQRSQVNKVTGNATDSYNGQTNPVWGTEVNDVVNANPVFTYFDTNGVKITGLPLDQTTPAGQQALASVKTIQISLRIQNPNVRDMKTGQPIETSFQGEVSINNCSMAITGQPMSC